MVRAYCRACDRAVDARGAWPGRCATCRTPIEPDPVADVLGPRLRVLFVGINPGVQTARARRHFANPRNRFWGLLHEAGFTPTRLGPEDEERLPRLGLGITNASTRATPGGADVTTEDRRRGRARLEALVARERPRLVAFVGKQAWVHAGGSPRQPFGPVRGGWRGAEAYVMPSTSPANAGTPRAALLSHFRAAARRAAATRTTARRPARRSRGA